MKFSSNFTFMLTALGYAAGFGSVWRFPYLVFKNGGGTFLVPYFFLLFTLAIPLFYLEISLGQLKGLGLAHLLELESPKFRGFGYIGIIICCYITSYYVYKALILGINHDLCYELPLEFIHLSSTMASRRTIVLKGILLQGNDLNVIQHH